MSSVMFRVKICGVTNVHDALEAAAAGADAIGLNFYAQSKRCVDMLAAVEIALAMPDHVAIVGVFVNEDPTDILNIATHLSLDFVQLHGDEPPEQIGQLASCQVVRAVRLGDPQRPDLARYLKRCGQLGASPKALLVDAWDPRQYGGTGAVADWSEVHRLKPTTGGMPIILAGGLTPDNVGEAISQAQPAAVDVASGVESRPGLKSSARMRAFVQAALAAWEATDS